MTMDNRRCGPLRLPVMALGVFAVLLMAGCANRFHHAWRLQQPEVATPEYQLNFIEADDRGWFWDGTQAELALDSVRRSAADLDTIVVVFVHGWHHSARCCDDNVQGFKWVLWKLDRVFQQPMFTSAQEAIHPGSRGVPHRVIGIYIGWRGGSLPGIWDYATFWGRKVAAERVGQTDLSEFLVRLQKIYERHNARDAAAGDPSNLAPVARPKTYLGLVTIGHSFGAQVVIRAVSATLEHQLEQLGEADGFLRAPSRTPIADLKEPAKGYGDLLLLVNPAVEAAAYERLHVLSSSLHYAASQTPLMLTISADNDVPRHRLFKWGRTVGDVLSRAAMIADERERLMERESLGFYDGPGSQETHRLEPADASLTLTKSSVSDQQGVLREVYCNGAADCGCTSYAWARPPAHGEPDSLRLDRSVSVAFAEEIKNYDFSMRTVFNDIILSPRDGGIPYQPFIEASAPSNVINGHNGMFSEPLLEFLVRYIGFIEAKRYLITADEKGWLTQARGK